VNGSEYDECISYSYESRRMKPDEIVLRRGGGRIMEGVNITKIYCQHIYKYHSVSPI
jgi:hypothetical protein